MRTFSYSRFINILSIYDCYPFATRPTPCCSYCCCCCCCFCYCYCRGHELDLAVTRIGSSSCPLRDIIAEIRSSQSFLDAYIQSSSKCIFPKHIFRSVLRLCIASLLSSLSLSSSSPCHDFTSQGRWERVKRTATSPKRENGSDQVGSNWLLAGSTEVGSAEVH